MIVNKISSLIGKVNVRYGENGSDPRNYRVDFSKVKSILGFEPIYSIDNGIEELLKMIKQNIFTDIGANKKFHGNYSIRYRFPS